MGLRESYDRNLELSEMTLKLASLSAHYSAQREQGKKKTKNRCISSDNDSLFQFHGQ